MAEQLSRTILEDAAASAETFLKTNLDGGFATQAIAGRVEPLAESAEALLRSVPYPGQAGLYVALSKHNANQYAQAVLALPGHVTLIPSMLVGDEIPALYPAVVSEDGIKSSKLRLHVLKQAYDHQHGLGYSAAMLLSAAGQSETPGVGQHSSARSDGVEAEHFSSLLVAGNNARVRAAWQSGGEHINHAWRQRANDSVLTELSDSLLSADMSLKTITITETQVKDGQAALFWHEGMRNAETGRPETATRKDALVVVQGLGYEALRNTNRQGLDVVKRLLDENS